MKSVIRNAFQVSPRLCQTSRVYLPKPFMLRVALQLSGNGEARACLDPVPRHSIANPNPSIGKSFWIELSPEVVCSSLQVARKQFPSICRQDAAAAGIMLPRQPALASTLLLVHGAIRLLQHIKHHGEQFRNVLSSQTPQTALLEGVVRIGGADPISCRKDVEKMCGDLRYVWDYMLSARGWPGKSAPMGPKLESWLNEDSCPQSAAKNCNQTHIVPGFANVIPPNWLAATDSEILGDIERLHYSLQELDRLILELDGIGLPCHPAAAGSVVAHALGQIWMRMMLITGIGRSRKVSAAGGLPTHPIPSSEYRAKFTSNAGKTQLKKMKKERQKAFRLSLTVSEMLQFDMEGTLHQKIGDRPTSRAPYFGESWAGAHVPKLDSHGLWRVPVMRRSRNHLETFSRMSLGFTLYQAGRGGSFDETPYCFQWQVPSKQILNSIETSFAQQIRLSRAIQQHMSRRSKTELSQAITNANEDMSPLFGSNDLTGSYEWNDSVQRFEWKSAALDSASITQAEEKSLSSDAMSVRHAGSFSASSDAYELACASFFSRFPEGPLLSMSFLGNGLCQDSQSLSGVSWKRSPPKPAAHKTARGSAKNMPARQSAADVGADRVRAYLQPSTIPTVFWAKNAGILRVRAAATKFALFSRHPAHGPFWSHKYSFFNTAAYLWRRTGKGSFDWLNARFSKRFYMPHVQAQRAKQHNGKMQMKHHSFVEKHPRHSSSQAESGIKQASKKKVSAKKKPLRSDIVQPDGSDIVHDKVSFETQASHSNRASSTYNQTRSIRGKQSKNSRSSGQAWGRLKKSL